MAEANASAVPEPPFSGGLADNLCVQMALIALIGLPGYYLSVCAMDRLGRRFIQLQVVHALMHIHMHWPSQVGLSTNPRRGSPLTLGRASSS